MARMIRAAWLASIFLACAGTAAGQTNNIGVEASPSVSTDGRYVAFESSANDLVSGDTNGASDIFVRDLQTGTTTRVSVDSAGHEANAGSWGPSRSADSRYVAFFSFAFNLRPEDANSALDVFVHDRQTGATILASIGSAGNQGNGSSYHPALSADGRFVVFSSQASNLVPGDTYGTDDIFVYDRQTGHEPAFIRIQHLADPEVE